MFRKTWGQKKSQRDTVLLTSKKQGGSQRRQAVSRSQKRQGKGFPLEPPGRNTATRAPWLQFSMIHVRLTTDPKTWKTISLCCFKLLRWWWFATAMVNDRGKKKQVWEWREMLVFAEYINLSSYSFHFATMLMSYKTRVKVKLEKLTRNF